MPDIEARKRTVPQAPDAGPRTDFVQSLARGLALIEAFGPSDPTLTIAQAARRTGMTRAGARRVLLTLVRLGYCALDERGFRLTPRVLNLGFSYLQAGGMWTLAQPFMVELVEAVHESCSAAVLDGHDVVYVARVPTQTRVMSISLSIGSRLPAHLTSMGRVLLGELGDEALHAHIESILPLRAITGYTITDARRLRDAIRSARIQGYAVLDQELEPGLRSIAVPIRGGDGRVSAALNIGTHASRVSMDMLTGKVLPQLRACADRIAQAILSPPLPPRPAQTSRASARPRPHRA